MKILTKFPNIVVHFIIHFILLGFIRDKSRRILIFVHLLISSEFWDVKYKIP